MGPWHVGGPSGVPVPRCCVKVAPGRVNSGPLTEWNKEEALLFRYFFGPAGACSYRIEGVLPEPGEEEPEPVGELALEEVSKNGGSNE